MMKKKIKKQFAVWLWSFAVCIFTIVSSGCANEDDWIAIEDMAPADRIDDDVSSESTVAVIQVYVCGAVKEPGVVSVPLGSRLEVALGEAGGFAENAARDRVNLADWVADGQMLYFPTEDEVKLRQYEILEEDKALVNINTASEEKLCTLPGIGGSRAADIIAYREKNGAFASCEEIMKVSGIKEAVYEKIKDKIKVE